MGAGVEFPTSMNLQVLPQMTEHGERHCTMGAAEGFLCSVNAQMCFQMFQPSKRF